MAALNRPSTANYEVHECVKVDTTDHEDHTFSGIMFPIKAKQTLPVECIVIRSVAVRGSLGPITVWVTNEDIDVDQSGRYNFRLDRRYWTKIYEQVHLPSRAYYQNLNLQERPIVLRPGQVRAVYIHSTLDGDEAIVYDNSVPTGRRLPPRYEDSMIIIHSGRAHLSPEPFGQIPIWGWGNAWRDRREFVGQLEYGAVFRLWNPELHFRFGNNFRKATEMLLLLQRHANSPFCRLPDECIFYILNMCRWDWFQDDVRELKTRYRKHRQRLKQERLQERQSVPRTTQDAHDSVDLEVQGNEEGVDEDHADWERLHGYRPDSNALSHHDLSSDEESQEEQPQSALDGRTAARQSWFRRRIASIQRLRSAQQNGDSDSDDDSDEDDSDEDWMM